jgi:hypothetical protein
MFHTVSKTSAFQDWVKNATDLNPKYDYFNFADMAMKDKSTIGSLYMSLNDALYNTPRK